MEETQATVAEKEIVAADVEATSDVGDSMAAEKRANDIDDEAEAERLAKEAAEKAAENAAKLVHNLSEEDRANRAKKANDEASKQTTNETSSKTTEKSTEKIIDSVETDSSAVDGNPGPTNSLEKAIDDEKTRSTSVDKPSSPSRNEKSTETPAKSTSSDDINAASSDAAKPTSSPEVKSTKGDLLKVGSTVPDFNCCCHDGTMFRFQSKELKNGIIFFFFLQGSTVGDRDEAKEFQLILGDLRKRGYRVVGVSTDPMPVSLEMVNSLNLEFPLLCDVEGQVCVLFGVSYKGYSRHKARRTVFVVNPDGVITHMDMHFKSRGGPTALMYKHCPNVALITS